MPTSTCQPQRVSHNMRTSTCKPKHVNLSKSTSTCQPQNVNLHVSNSTCQPQHANINVLTSASHPQRVSLNMSTLERTNTVINQYKIEILLMFQTRSMSDLKPSLNTSTTWEIPQQARSVTPQSNNKITFSTRALANLSISYHSVIRRCDTKNEMIVL